MNTELKKCTVANCKVLTANECGLCNEHYDIAALSKAMAKNARCNRPGGRWHPGEHCSYQKGHKGPHSWSPELEVPASVSIIFDTGEYRRSHLHEPRGRGSWAFAAHPDADVVHGTIWTPSMTYGEAKAYAKRLLRGRSSDDDVVANPTLWANNREVVRKGFSMRGSRVYIYVLS